MQNTASICRALRHLAPRASASLSPDAGAVTLAFSHNGNVWRYRMTPQRDYPVILVEYFVYALGVVILCALVAAFYFIDKPVDFSRFW